MTPRRRWLFRILALCGAVILALGATELALRLLGRGPRFGSPVGSLVPDPDCHYINARNFTGVWESPEFRVGFTLNELGFREYAQQSLTPPPGGYRILFLGDSYVQGRGVSYEEMFATLAERDARPPNGCARVEILKAGVSGWGPVAEAKWLKRDGLAYGPAAVFAFLFIGNDLFDAQAPDASVLVDGVVMDRAIFERSPDLLRAKIALRNHLLLYGFMVDAARGLTMNTARRYAEDKALLDLCDPRQALPLDALREAYRGMRDQCRAAGVPLRVILLPHRTQVEPDRLKLVCEKLHLDPAAYDPDRPNKELLAIFKEDGIDARDLTPVVRETAKSGPIGFPSDSHYTARVHALVGKALAEMLTNDPPPCAGGCCGK